jgi:aryl-alcohol dehydrogenase-like predicted oxidoreductase
MTDRDRQTAVLGASGIEVFPIGLGCMGMSQFYGPSNREDSIATIRGALDRGVNFLDTSDVYGAADAIHGQSVRGFGHNESLIAEAIQGRREEVILGTKFGAKQSKDGSIAIDNSPEYVRAACDASLKRLGTEHIDLYYAHRIDPTVPVEETVGAIADLVTAGKVRAIGLSEVDAATLRRAHVVHPISALQSEYSLWERSIEKDIVPLCVELGITLVPYSPLGRAMLTGRLTNTESLSSTDFRSTIPRFQGEDFRSNLELVGELRALGDKRGMTPGQIALAWLLMQPQPVTPIPGTRRIQYLEENVAAANFELDASEIAELNTIFDPAKVRGARYGT